MGEMLDAINEEIREAYKKACVCKDCGYVSEDYAAGFGCPRCLYRDGAKGVGDG